MGFTYLQNVSTLDLQEGKCTGCAMCLTVCPHEVFRLAGNKVEIADRDACMECGACQRNCPAGAIRVRAGVGCAYALLYSRLKGRPEPVCGQEDAGCGSVGGGDNTACC